MYVVEVYAPATAAAARARVCATSRRVGGDAGGVMLLDRLLARSRFRLSEVLQYFTEITTNNR